MTIYILSEILPSQPPRKVCAFGDKESALSYVQGIAQCWEEDDDFPGCYDIFTKRGQVMTLEPASKELL